MANEFEFKTPESYCEIKLTKLILASSWLRISVLITSLYWVK